MKTTYLALSILIITLVSCGKSGDDLSEMMPINRSYKLVESIDSTITVDSTISAHSTIDSTINLTITQDFQTLWLGADTFKFNSSDGYFHSDTFPRIKLFGDSISITNFLGGVGTQVYNEKLGIRL